MKWYKHFSKAHRDTKIKKLINDYGATGYAVYFYCLELIADSIEQEQTTFELEDDAELISQYLKIEDTKLVEKIMKRCVDLGLFGMSESGKITCLKMAKFLDERFTRNNDLKTIIRSEQIKQIKKSLSSDNPRQSETMPRRLDETRREEKKIRYKHNFRGQLLHHVSEFVLLSWQEYYHLKQLYGNKTNLRWAINKLDCAIQAKGYKYESHAAVLKDGGWVHSEFMKNSTRLNTGAIPFVSSVTESDKKRWAQQHEIAKQETGKLSPEEVAKKLDGINKIKEYITRPRITGMDLGRPSGSISTETLVEFGKQASRETLDKSIDDDEKEDPWKSLGGGMK